MISMVVLWDFYRFSIENLCNLYGVSMIFDGVSKGVSMLVVWDSYGGSKGCLWDCLWIPMGFLLYFYDISWNFFGMSMIFLRDYYGISKGMSMIFLWDSYGVSKGYLWDFHWIPIEFL